MTLDAVNVSEYRTWAVFAVQVATDRSAMLFIWLTDWPFKQSTNGFTLQWIA